MGKTIHIVGRLACIFRANQDPQSIFLTPKTSVYPNLVETHTSVSIGFWFLVCYAATQLATPLHQRRMQVVRSNKVARKRLTESNGTPAISFVCEDKRGVVLGCVCVCVLLCFVDPILGKSRSQCHSLNQCVLLCFIKPILGNRYLRSRGCIVSKPRETHPRSEIADVPISPCPPLDNLGCLNPHPSP